MTPPEYTAHPADSTACKAQGDACLDAGKFQEAVQHYRQAIALNPDYAEAYSNLGITLWRQQQFQEAEQCLKQAVLIKPGLANAYYNLGSFLQEQGRMSEAIQQFSKALELGPEVEAYYLTLCHALSQAGQIQTARKVILRGLAANANSADFHFFLGNLYAQENDSDNAIACYRKALEIRPDYFEVHYNLGNLLQLQEKPDLAIACYQQALSFRSGVPDVYFNLGVAYKTRGNYNDAIAAYQKVIALRPDLADGYCNLANVFFEQGRLDEAITAYRKALELKPDFANASYGLGISLTGQQKYTEAVACFRKTLALEPDHLAARSLLLYQLQQLCEWQDLDVHVKAVRLAAAKPLVKHSDALAPFAFLAIPGATPEEQMHCSEKWARDEFRVHAILREQLGFDVRRNPADKISLGYISADFREHPVSYLMAEVFELHDRDRFHITAYSYGPDDGSPMRKRLENAFDDFVDIHANSVVEAAQRIYAAHTNVLVDLSGYTQDSRSAILALRPAPIQVNYLGYPGTMGADFVDYLIADRFAIPPDQRQYYTEQVVWMPDCFQANDRSRPHPSAPTRKECGLPESSFVFCCFNQSYKITPQMFDIWCKLLKAVPGSVLWLPAANPQAGDNLKREAANRGVDAERIVIAPFAQRDVHLARLQCADLFLDTLPYNAGTTCSDALWMGLPVVTCAGEAFATRMAGSLLTAIGVPELITYNLDDYYQLALELATDKDRLAAIRNKIRANRDTYPLFDSERFTRNLEQLYMQMVAEYCENAIR